MTWENFFWIYSGIAAASLIFIMVTILLAPVSDDS